MPRDECLSCGVPVEEDWDCPICEACFDRVLFTQKQKEPDLDKNKIGSFPRAKEKTDAVG